MANHGDVCARWVENTLNGHQRNALQGHNVITGQWGEERDRIYSYGRHFEMARLLRDKKGNPIAYLINGDTFSNTTSKHQGQVRAAIAGSRLPSVIIPHSVLNSAGIEPESVRLIDVLPDRLLTTTREYREMQPRWTWRDVHNYAYRCPTEAEKAEDVAREHQRLLEDWERRQRCVWADIDAGHLFGFWVGREDPFPPKPPRWEDITGWSRKREEIRYIESTDRVLFTSPTGGREVDVLVDEHGEPLFRDTWSRHVLGEAVIEARIPYTIRVKCKDCGGTGARPVVVETYDYWQQDLERLLYAIYTRGVGEQWRWEDVERRRKAIAEHHTQQLACPGCATSSRWGEVRSRGTGRRRATRHRTARFLSGFDHGEPRLSYFFCELPDRKPATVEEAYAALKPDTVRLAEQMGREVKRQGDIFAIPMPSLTKRDLTKMGATHERAGQLLGTNHVATDVAYMPDGTTYARGILKHQPEFRRPDHVRVRLEPKVWHLIRKNTVPISA